MSWEDYWNGEPVMLDVYYKSYVMRQKETLADMDRQAWFIGSYTTHAMNVVLSAAYADKDTPSYKLPKYPSEPLFTKEIFLTDEEREKAEEERQQRELAASYMNFCKATQLMGCAME